MRTTQTGLSRRDLLTAIIASGASGVAVSARSAAATARDLETTRIRLPSSPGICIAPQWVAEDLLRAEGFTDIQYVKVKPYDIEDAIGGGDADISMTYGLRWVYRLDSGLPITVLAGIHTGCNELFVTERVRSLSDLRGKTLAVGALGGVQHHLVAIVLKQIGLDWQKDVKVEVHPSADAIRLLGEGKIDALLTLPPEPQELRARKIGHSVVNSSVDRPWSQYFCCVATANWEFVRRSPVAAKRALRAMLIANSICALEPDRVARHLVDNGFTKRYDYAFQTLKDIPYSRWRDFHPEDTVRFYALRLHEAGMIKVNPNKLIAQGTDWRFLNELKKELKG